MKSTVTAPTAKAKTSVTLVTVMETPACFRASAIFSSVLRCWRAASFLTLLTDCMMTNMSSMPIPRHTRGRTLCIEFQEYPSAELKLRARQIPIPIQTRPETER